ncbi:sulfate adenylyltransferase subunit 1 [Streptomyces sp. SAI-129]|uniref:sulfate adenylyltransferase subunit 1 n=1 Tax=Streptomyces sp. SAI-129 TaxID=3377727 RepID=UPI003C7BBF25
MNMLRFATAGSVDDGKSTLIGRLLYDSKSLFDDQLSAIEAVSSARGDDYTDLSLLTDGLRAEREQGITIDVAYRYFSTPRRKFIVADTPGHTQYTRNMITGASTADLALVLADARKGLVEQSRRHALLCTLLGVRHLVLCVNKMDLVDFSQAQFEELRAEFTDYTAEIGARDVTVIPVSALRGDNVVHPSPNMPWYDGPALLAHLENVPAPSVPDSLGARLPVQYVIRPQSTRVTDHRSYAGQMAAGVLRTGDEVLVLPSRATTRITRINAPGGSVPEARPPMSVTVELADEFDISRGDLLCHPHDTPVVSQEFQALVCWMNESQALDPTQKYAVKHTTRTARAMVRQLGYRLDINTLREEPAKNLAVNEIGSVSLRTTVPLTFDSYRRNRTMGGFILIDESTNRTVGAGIVT